MGEGMSLKGFFIIFCLTLSAAEGWATMSSIPGSRFTSARAAALGNAFLPLAERGGEALFYNPAAIGKLQGVHFDPFDFQLMTNNDLIGNYGIDAYKITDLGQFKTPMAFYPGTMGGAGYAALPNFFFRGFSLGLLYQAESAAQLNGSNVRYRSQYLFVPAAGFAVRLARGIVRIGYSLQYVSKAQGDVTTTYANASSFKAGIAEGGALSHNLAYALTLPVSMNPALNIVARNLLGAAYTMPAILSVASSPSGVPATEPMSIDAALSITPGLGKGGTMNLVLQMNDLLNSSNSSLLSRISFGMEFDIHRKFFLRTGYGNGYPSAGFGIHSQRGEISLAWYSEEYGTSWMDLREVRYLFHWQLNVF